MTAADEALLVWKHLHTQVFRKICCEGGCGASRATWIAVMPSRDQAHQLIVRSFLLDGWMSCSGKWLCPRCWASLVASRPLDPAIENAVRSCHQLRQVEVVAA